MTPTNIQPQELSWAEIKNIVNSVSDQVKRTSEKVEETTRQMNKVFRKMRETDYILKETSDQIKETDKQMKETGKQMKESFREMRENTDRVLKETSEQIKQTDLQLKQTDLQLKQTDLQIEETNRKYKELATAFTSTIGNLTEGLLDPSAVCIFQKAGFDVNRYFGDIKKRDKNKKLEMQIDQFMVNGTTAIAMEIKTTCTPDKIDYFIKKMDRFKDLFPEYADKTVYLAIAAIKYEKESDIYAHEKGLMVVRATPDNIFTLDSTEGDTLLTF